MLAWPRQHFQGYCKYTKREVDFPLTTFQGGLLFMKVGQSPRCNAFRRTAFKRMERPTSLLQCFQEKCFQTHGEANFPLATLSVELLSNARRGQHPPCSAFRRTAFERTERQTPPLQRFQENCLQTLGEANTPLGALSGELPTNARRGQHPPCSAFKRTAYKRTERQTPPLQRFQENCLQTLGEANTPLGALSGELPTNARRGQHPPCSAFRRTAFERTERPTAPLQCFQENCFRTHGEANTPLAALSGELLSNARRGQQPPGSAFRRTAFERTERPTPPLQRFQENCLQTHGEANTPLAALSGELPTHAWRGQLPPCNALNRTAFIRMEKPTSPLQRFQENCFHTHGEANVPLATLSGKLLSYAWRGQRSPCNAFRNLYENYLCDLEEKEQKNM
ncbi:hypothetical protein V1264_012260 [Littorina saxatilis]|uniref:Uncharacterized protein n=1 Tax=Littorina saxatilis TaxID=31220 RepID=A0AAN9BW07_9CAEN